MYLLLHQEEPLKMFFLNYMQKESFSGVDSKKINLLLVLVLTVVSQFRILQKDLMLKLQKYKIQSKSTF
ncbi:hypothetical protein BIY26_06710 [Brenneria goodwinii]|uniref:Uncharacterized protein n=1 Tax=Brenneria goodwinii TaxID=1109412 RepID=A0AAE8EUM0_9GAMM|nr:hypothetical protein BIY26_06710 [Brenneria goodwinii]